MNKLLSDVIFGIVAALGIGFLMVVHEGGHFLLARLYKMRVKTFSIGFGPAIYKRQPKGSETTYQIALVPFLAYVQIAGMNPFEETDPEDKASYANAKLHGRILTIFAGPLANYLVASLLFFAAFSLNGTKVLTTTIQEVVQDSPAMAAGLATGDKILEVAGETIKDWEHLRSVVGAHPNEKIQIVVERGGQKTSIAVTPKAEGKEGRIGVKPMVVSQPLSIGKAAVLSVEAPPKVVAGALISLAYVISGKEKAELAGPLGIGKELKRAVERGIPDYLELLGMLSAYLAAFNLLPIPALDGGRLVFLGYEAITRRRPNARVEASIHMVFLVMLLMAIAVVTIFDVRKLGQ